MKLESKHEIFVLLLGQGTRVPCLLIMLLLISHMSCNNSAYKICFMFFFLC